jgi:hypothetical protein
MRCIFDFVKRPRIFLSNFINGKFYELESGFGDYAIPTQRYNWVWTREYMIHYKWQNQNKEPEDGEFRCMYENEFENHITLCKYQYLES